MRKLLLLFTLVVSTVAFGQSVNPGINSAKALLVEQDSNGNYSVLLVTNPNVNVLCGPGVFCGQGQFVLGSKLMDFIETSLGACSHNSPCPPDPFEPFTFTDGSSTQNVLLIWLNSGASFLLNGNFVIVQTAANQGFDVGGEFLAFTASQTTVLDTIRDALHQRLGQ